MQESCSLEALPIAALLEKAGVLFEELSGTLDEPKVADLDRVLAELGRRAAGLHGVRKYLCACGEKFTHGNELDDHLAEFLAPADDTGTDGLVHAEVVPGTPVPWPAADASRQRLGW